MIYKIKAIKNVALWNLAFVLIFPFLSLEQTIAQGSVDAAKEELEKTSLSKDTTKPAKKYELAPIPVIAVNPTTGVLGGILLGVNFKMGDPAKETRTSAYLGGVYYTSNNQLFTSLRGSAFTEENKLFMLTDIRFNLNSQPTYGLGSNITLASQTIVGDDGEVSDDPYNKVPKQEMMAFNNFRFYQTIQKRLTGKDRRKRV